MGSHRGSSSMRTHAGLDDAKRRLCEQAGLLGEPCDRRLLIEHYGKHPLRMTLADIGSEGAMVYVIVVACIYLFFVALLVSLNQRAGKENKKSEGSLPGEEGPLKKFATVSFQENSGSYLTHVTETSADKMVH